MAIKSVGSCNFCKENFSGNAMTKHLNSCKERIKLQSEENKGDKIFLVKAGNSPFWVYFEVKETSTLNDIDDFLRDLWLECCGHLSIFNINGINFAYSPQPEYGDRSMNVQLKNVLTVTLSFSYEYDFGTTTYLNLKCVSERKGRLKDKISILAQNQLPKFSCDSCEKTAKEICTQCIWEGEGLLCQDCAKNHKCEEEMFLPVVNSPRMGMCGYTGE